MASRAPWASWRGRWPSMGAGSRAGEMTAMGGACCCREGEGERRGEEGSRAGGLPFKEASSAAIGRDGRPCCRALHMSVCWQVMAERHFPFGIEPGSLQKICSLMYTLQIVYRD
jgi:hypothetical protein